MKRELMNGILMQGINTVNGLQNVSELSLRESENWTRREIESFLELTSNEAVGSFIKSALYDNELELKEIPYLVSLINSKRCFVYELNGIKYKVVIPSDRAISEGVINDYNSKLLKLAIAYYAYVDFEVVTPFDKKKKEELHKRFIYLKNSISYMISSRIFSKRFKEKYKFRFNGLSGVALTGNASIDGIFIPEWYAEKNKIKVGDFGLVTRDPIQNIFIVLKVEGFTCNEIRINSLTYTYLDGDHDGDKIQFIPINKMIKMNKEYIDDIDLFLSQLMELVPSVLFDNKDFSPLLVDYVKPSEEHYQLKPMSSLDMLMSSKKSEKYIGKIEQSDYVENQYNTVLNMRTVKDGTGFAGAFCNWIMEQASVLELDLITSRTISNLIQRLSLDSKHNSVTGKGYKSEIWFKLTELRKKSKGKSLDKIIEDIYCILNDSSECIEYEEDSFIM